MTGEGRARGRDGEPRESEAFSRMHIDVQTTSRVRALVIMLLSLGYRKIRWQPDPRGVFTAFDEHRIATVIVVDVSPLSEGYPVPRLSPGRAEGMHDICIAYLQDHVRTSKVRADYIALPDTRDFDGRLALTQRRGVAWAFAKERSNEYAWRERARRANAAG